MSSIDPPDDPNHVRRRLRSTTRADKAAAAGASSNIATSASAPEPAPSPSRDKSSGKSRRKDPGPRATGSGATQPAAAAPREKVSPLSTNADEASAKPVRSSSRSAARLARKKSAAAVNVTAQAQSAPSGTGSAALESTIPSLDTTLGETSTSGGDHETVPATQPLLRRGTRVRKPVKPAAPAADRPDRGNGSLDDARNEGEAVSKPPLRRSTRARKDSGHTFPTSVPSVASSSPPASQSTSTAAIQPRGPSSNTNLQRAALNHARSMREQTPIAMPQSEPAPGFSTPKPKYNSLQAHTLNTQVHATPHGHTTRTGTMAGDSVEVTKKQLEKELKPISFCDPQHVTTLYRDLASDEKIDAFLRGPRSGFTVHKKRAEAGSGGDRGNTETRKQGSGNQNERSSTTASGEGANAGGSAGIRRSGRGGKRRETVEDVDEESKSTLGKGGSGSDGDTSKSTSSPSPSGHWDDIPPAPVALECNIYPGLVKIIVKIQKHLSAPASPGVSRTVLDCSAKDFKHINHQNTRPDIVICATGPSFEVPKAEDPEQHLGGKKSSKKDLHNVGYTNAAAVIEVKRDSSNDTDWDNVAQAGMYCREIWAQQANRLFARALIVTETRVRLIHYDRAGVFATPFFNYHEDPRTFVRLILGLISTDEDVLGLDTSIHWKIDPETKRKKSGTITICDENKKSVDYTMLSVTPDFIPHSIRGRGTTCWRVRHPNGGKVLLIKDSWRTGTRKPESEYLAAAKAIPGVVNMKSFQDKIGETNNFRPASYHGTFSYHNRVKLRIVMEAHGLSILNYRSRYELVAALKDAIRAHRGLYDALILHRDISAANILLGLDEDGVRGVLIDLDMAIWIDRKASEVSSDVITGTRLYQSLAVLSSYDIGGLKVPHDYLDDLESFFYVLCHAMFSRVSAGQSVNPKATRRLETWQLAPTEAVGNKSELLIGGAFQFELIDVEYWGSACSGLLAAFHKFLSDIMVKKRAIRYRTDLDHNAKVQELKALGSGIEIHYDGIDAMFQEALDKLKTEEPQILARIGDAAAGDAGSDTTGSASASNTNIGPMKRSLELDLNADSSGRAAKRRNDQDTVTALPIQNDSMDLDE